MAQVNENTGYGVLPPKFGGGPHGLGDPNDRSLRKVEVEVMVPKIMRERAKTEKCIPEVEGFTECCKNTGLLMVVKCRKENDALKSCLNRWYLDETFKRECTEQYLRERSEFRRTGVMKKHRGKEHLLASLQEKQQASGNDI